MKNKLVCAMLVSAMALQIVACGAGDVAKAEVVKASEITEDACEGEEIKIDSYDFEGQYYAGKGNLSITYEGDDSFLIEVWWPNNAAEHSEWTMNATYDPATKTLSYRDCVKHDFTLKDNGEVDTDVTAYTDGTGSIVIVDNSTIMWNDDVDHIADEVSLTR